MNMLKRMMIVVMDMAFVFLAMKAFIIMFGFVANLLATGGHSHWAATGLALVVTLALRVFVWLLPLTALVFIIGSLAPSASQK
jgi:nitric oxide reductase large subunit